MLPDIGGNSDLKAHILYRHSEILQSESSHVPSKATRNTRQHVKVLH